VVYGFFVEAYFEFLVCGFLSLSAPLTTAFGEIISFLLGVCTVLISILILPTLQIFLIYNDNIKF
jgi:hypothetical protein